MGYIQLEVQEATQNYPLLTKQQHLWLPLKIITLNLSNLFQRWRSSIQVAKLYQIGNHQPKNDFKTTMMSRLSKMKKQLMNLLKSILKTQILIKKKILK